MVVWFKLPFVFATGCVMKKPADSRALQSGFPAALTRWLWYICCGNGLYGAEKNCGADG